jgi:hypothetical protein
METTTLNEHEDHPQYPQTPNYKPIKLSQWCNQMATQKKKNRSINI